MLWIRDLLFGSSVAHGLVVICLVIALGLGLGRLNFRGLGLGIAGVLFSGILLREAGLAIDEVVLKFLREFGLILFVYSIGIQVGPGFFAAFRRQGLALNALAATVVLGDVAVAVGIYFFTKVPLSAVAGLLSGAVTNTPSLGAATQALREGNVADPQLAGQAYAIAYPFGIIGIIVAMYLVRLVFRISLRRETEAFERVQADLFPAPANMNLEVRNPQLVGQKLLVIHDLVKPEVVVSRLLRGQEVCTPTLDTLLQLGDKLHVVGARDSLEKLRLVVGDESHVDVRAIPSQLDTRKIFVTQAESIGKPLGALDFPKTLGANVTRIERGGHEFIPSASVELHFGDTVTAVGNEEALRNLSNALGNSLAKLNHPNVLPLFMGILAGVLLGTIPFSIPGVPSTVRLGLAGGPLLVAIVLGRLGRLGPFTFYMPLSANLVLRETGIALFLACVGLKAGHGFFHSLAGQGLVWMGLGAIVTFVPLMMVAIAARLFYKMNYLSLCGLLAGSMTDPPALAFAHSVTGSNGPAVTYATVYPVVMFLRVITVQLLVIFLAR